MIATTQEPRWTAENMNRREGATTLQSCGWCEYAGGGSCRYSCHLTTSCTLLSSWRQPKELHWDTPCLFLTMGKSDVIAAMESKRREAEDLRQSAIRSDNRANALVQIAATKPDIPAHPDNRKHDHFNIGDRLRVFHPDKWNTAVVVNGYRHHDGCVSYVFDDLPPLPEWLRAADRAYNGNSLPMAEMRAAFDAQLAEAK